MQKVKPSRSIVESQSHKQNAPRPVNKGLTWRFVNASGNAQTARKRPCSLGVLGACFKKNKKLDSNFVS